MSRTTFVPVAPAWYASNTGGLVLTGLLAARTRRRLLWFVLAAGTATHVVETVGTQEYSFTTASFLVRLAEAYGDDAAADVQPHLPGHQS